MRNTWNDIRINITEYLELSPHSQSREMITVYAIKILTFVLFVRLLCSFKSKKSRATHFRIALHIYYIYVLVLQLRSQELAVKASDVCDRDRLRTLSLASTCVSTVTEAQLIHLSNHSPMPRREDLPLFNFVEGCKVACCGYQ